MQAYSQSQLSNVGYSFLYFSSLKALPAGGLGPRTAFLANPVAVLLATLRAIFLRPTFEVVM